MGRFSEAERVEVWYRWQAGETTRAIGRRLGRSGASIRAFAESTGVVRPNRRRRSVRHLTLTEREEISRGVAAGESLRQIARRLGRAASTVSRELARNGGRVRYRAHRADRAAWRWARRPKPSKLATHGELREVVEGLLADCWSPQQISGWLRRSYADDEEMRVSHEKGCRRTHATWDGSKSGLSRVPWFQNHDGSLSGSTRRVSVQIVVD